MPATGLGVTLSVTAVMGVILQPGVRAWSMRTPGMLQTCSFPSLCSDNCQAAAGNISCTNSSEDCGCEPKLCLQANDSCLHACNETDLIECLECSFSDSNSDCHKVCDSVCLDTGCGFTSNKSLCKGCVPGYYGDACKHICSSACKESCFDDTGYCKFCEPGWFGQKCQERCPRECRKCSSHNGLCLECEDGYMGPACETACPEGFFGAGCQKQCSENCVNMCDHISGFCLDGCKPGFYGRPCVSKCPSGTYGQGCIAECAVTCAKGSTCHHVNGSCLSGCRPGFQGSQCDTACSMTTYGANCSINCSSNCFYGICNRFSGHCQLCVTGREGVFCDKMVTAQHVRIVEDTMSRSQTVLIFLALFAMGFLSWWFLSIFVRQKQRVVREKLERAAEQAQVPYQARARRQEDSSNSTSRHDSQPTTLQRPDSSLESDTRKERTRNYRGRLTDGEELSSAGDSYKPHIQEKKSAVSLRPERGKRRRKLREEEMSEDESSPSSSSAERITRTHRRQSQDELIKRDPSVDSNTTFDGRRQVKRKSKFIGCTEEKSSDESAKKRKKKKRKYVEEYEQTKGRDDSDNKRLHHSKREVTEATMSNTEMDMSILSGTAQDETRLVSEVRAKPARIFDIAQVGTMTSNVAHVGTSTSNIALVVIAPSDLAHEYRTSEATHASYKESDLSEVGMVESDVAQTEVTASNVAQEVNKTSSMAHSQTKTSEIAHPKTKTSDTLITKKPGITQIKTKLSLTAHAGTKQSETARAESMEINGVQKGMKPLNEIPSTMSAQLEDEDGTNYADIPLTENNSRIRGGECQCSIHQFQPLTSLANGELFVPAVEVKKEIYSLHQQPVPEDPTIHERTRSPTIYALKVVKTSAVNPGDSGSEGRTIAKHLSPKTTPSPCHRSRSRRTRRRPETPSEAVRASTNLAVEKQTSATKDSSSDSDTQTNWYQQSRPVGLTETEMNVSKSATSSDVSATSTSETESSTDHLPATSEQATSVATNVTETSLEALSTKPLGLSMFSHIDFQAALERQSQSPYAKTDLPPSIDSGKAGPAGQSRHNVGDAESNSNLSQPNGVFQRGLRNLANAVNKLFRPNRQAREKADSVKAASDLTSSPRPQWPSTSQFVLYRLEAWRREQQLNKGEDESENWLPQSSHVGETMDRTSTGETLTTRASSIRTTTMNTSSQTRRKHSSVYSSEAETTIFTYSQGVSASNQSSPITTTAVSPSSSAKEEETSAELEGSWTKVDNMSAMTWNSHHHPGTTRYPGPYVPKCNLESSPEK